MAISNHRKYYYIAEKAISPHTEAGSVLGTPLLMLIRTVKEHL